MMDVEPSVSSLLAAQHADGGWGYGSVSSWAEPTCYAILALEAKSAGRSEIARAAAWLSSLWRQDGGFAPASGVEEATAVTSLMVLALSGQPAYRNMLDGAVDWLLGFKGVENSVFLQMLRTVAGRRSALTDHPAWPWFPGTSAWVAPTSLTLLALRKHVPQPYPAAVANRIREGQDFLLVRRCPDSGWNHGGTARANEVPFSYPETTGLALLALRGVDDPSLARSLDRAEALYRDSPSAEGDYWLRLALRAHNRNLPAPPRQRRDWNVNSLALRMIVESAEAGRNPLVEVARA
jgi:hypothetical protein